MTDEELNKKLEEEISKGNVNALTFLSSLGNDSWVKDVSDIYQVGFYGFSSKKSSEFSLNGLNQDSTYQDIASTIVSQIAKNNTKAYHINDEGWLIDKIRKYKEGDMDALSEIPDLVILPDDVVFSDELNNLIVSLSENNISSPPIRVKYVSTKTKDDENTIYMGDIVKYDSNTNSTYIDIVDRNIKPTKDNPNQINKDSFNSFETFTLDMGQSRTSKLVSYYKKKCDNISKYLDEFYGTTKLENEELYTKDSSGNLSNVNMDFMTLREYVSKGIPLYDKYGNNYNLTMDDINNAEDKSDVVLSQILQLYSEKEKYTYNHIEGMRSVIPIINNGLDDSEKLSEAEMRELDRMVILHDVGKLSTPLEVLSSPNRLSDSEFKVMQGHVMEDNITVMRNSFINSSLDKALMHHVYVDERFENVQRDKLTKMLSVLDVYNALTADRSYKNGFSDEKAFSIMNEEVEKGKIDGHYLEALEKGIVMQQENEHIRVA